ncbi:MAG TPA: DUF4920 domain-containing protein, partial [Patescibacteria group bacterium]|nr:DUF4920 domain-containing protein [Patescibacteria group bacterium]
APAPTVNAAGGYGEVIAADAKADALAAALAKLSADNASVDGLFSGRVGKVCQKQGCWLQLIDGEQMARVMTNHDFTVPKDLSGNAVVSGKLERVEISEKEARHMAEDAGKDFDPAASRVEYRIAARGVVAAK